MKVHKMVCVDYEIAQRLSEEDNASAIVNSLLMAHYKGLHNEEEIIAEVKKKIKDKEHKAKIKKLINKQLKREAKNGI